MKNTFSLFDSILKIMGIMRIAVKKVIAIAKIVIAKKRVWFYDILSYAAYM